MTRGAAWVAIVTASSSDPTGSIWTGWWSAMTSIETEPPAERTSETVSLRLRADRHAYWRTHSDARTGRWPRITSSTIARSVSRPGWGSSAGRAARAALPSNRCGVAGGVGRGARADPASIGAGAKVASPRNSSASASCSADGATVSAYGTRVAICISRASLAQ